MGAADEDLEGDEDGPWDEGVRLRGLDLRLG